jgi:hypothetical protein
MPRSMRAKASWMISVGSVLKSNVNDRRSDSMVSCNFLETASSDSNVVIDGPLVETGGRATRLAARTTL